MMLSWFGFVGHQQTCGLGTCMETEICAYQDNGLLTCMKEQGVQAYC